MTTSIIIPVYNGESTIEQTLESLFNQNIVFDELIIINDGSTDQSEKLIRAFLKNHKHNSIQIITHKKPKGLAFSYNEGIGSSTGQLIITLHQDVVLERNSLAELLKPFSQADLTIVASTHCVLHPIKIWESYNFWQKCYFARMVNKKFCGLDGKFDCFRRSTLDKIGLFDQTSFRTAGEDGDLRRRLRQAGKIITSGATIIHLHRVDNNFKMKDIIYKHAQYSEAQGVLFRRGSIAFPVEFVKTFFREILLILLFIPYIRYASLALIVAYSILYSAPVLYREYKNPRILILPFLNIFLLIVSLYYAVRGLATGKQMV